MLRTRIIPCLLLRDEALVKTTKFKRFGYIGDPANTVRIFNELEVDELVFLDILASRKNQEIKYDTLQDIANEAFMPVSYGGGIKSFDQIKKILSIGFEKVVINTQAVQNPNLIRESANHFGNQSIIGSIDVKKDFFGKKKVVIKGASKFTKLNPVDWAIELENLGVGELLVTSVDNEGTWQGFDYNLLREIADKVSVPVIANGGAGNIDHIEKAVKNSNVSAISLGSMVVYQKKGYGVLINFPDRNELEKRLY